MTREEVIAELVNMWKFNYTLADDEVFEKAIQALLEQEPTSPWDLCRFDYMDDVCVDCPAMAKEQK